MNQENKEKSEEGVRKAVGGLCCVSSIVVRQGKEIFCRDKAGQRSVGRSKGGGKASKRE